MGETRFSSPITSVGITAGGGMLLTQNNERTYRTTGVNVNSANTDVATFTGLPAKYVVRALTGFDSSTDLTTATVSLRTASAGAGTALVSAQALSALSAAAKFDDITLEAVAGTDYQTAATLYLRNVTAQGGAATASFILTVTDLTA